MKQHLILFTALTLPAAAAEFLETYSYPDIIVPPSKVQDASHTLVAETLRSAHYAVSVTQANKAKETYVMFTPNPHETGNLSASPHTHWTNFSFSGKVTVTVTKLAGSIESVEIYPTRKGHTATILGDTATFILNSADGQLPLQLYLRINENRDHPLLVFADPPETDVPNRKDKKNVDVIRTTDDIATVRAKLNSKKPYAVFEEGIHQWGNTKTNAYAGYRLPYKSGKRIYIPGGAYVIGTFAGDSISDAKIYGRGVLSACGKDRLANNQAIPYSMIHQTGNASDQLIEGIVTTDAPHFHLTFRGQVTIDNVKMIGYWYQTDGTVTGDNSVVRNTFMKTNDDYIKLYSNNSYHFNNTMFHQVNGAPFQFCWGSQNGDNNLVEETYIIFSSYSNGENLKKNTAVINARNAPGKVTENNTWDGLYIDNGCHRLIGLNAQNEPDSVYRNFIIRNVHLNTGFADSPQDGASYLRDGSAGNFFNIRLENLFIDGKPVNRPTKKQDADGEGNLWISEGGEYLTFVTKGGK